MTEFADEIAALIRDEGEPVVVKYQIGAVVDGATGEVTTPGVDVTVNAYGCPVKYRKDEVDGTVIKDGDIRLYLERISAVPQPGWTATLNGETLRIMASRPIRNRADNIIFICQLRAR